MLNNIAEMRVSMVGEELPDHPADDLVVGHLLEGCVKAGREGKRARQHIGVQTPRRWMDGWMDGWMDRRFNIQSQLLMLI
jgi:hypothetical protein